MTRILIVDDEHPIQVAVARLLRRKGYECSFASNAVEALLELELHPCELMLCDINMPGESGLELARHVLQESGQVAVVMATALDDTNVAEQALELGAYGYLIKPWRQNELLITISNALRRRALELKYQNHQQQLILTVEERTHHLRSSREETILRLARAAEFRDYETAQHNQRMSHYCALIAARWGKTDEECDQIRLASMLHDVGKIGIPDQVLLKPGKFTEEELGQIRTHPEIGYRILSGSNSALLKMGATIALTHHEKFDGSGYPHGLAGEAIPLEGRFAAVADVFDALTSNRVYRKAWSVERTVECLVAERGGHFDPRITDLFLGSLDEVIAIKERHTDIEVGPTKITGRDPESGLSSLACTSGTVSGL